MIILLIFGKMGVMDVTEEAQQSVPVVRVRVRVRQVSWAVCSE